MRRSKLASEKPLAVKKNYPPQPRHAEKHAKESKEHTNTAPKSAKEKKQKARLNQREGKERKPIDSDKRVESIHAHAKQRNTTHHQEPANQ